MRSRSPANRAASSPPVPARTSSIAARSSAASRGSSWIASARSACGSLCRISSASAAAISLSSGSAVGSATRPLRTRARREAGALRARRRRPARSPHSPSTGERTPRATDRRATSRRQARAGAPRSTRCVRTRCESPLRSASVQRWSSAAARCVAATRRSLKLSARRARARQSPIDQRKGRRRLHWPSSTASSMLPR